jgi:TonB family protein
MKNLAKTIALVCVSTLLTWGQVNETKPATQPDAAVPTPTTIPDSTKLKVIKKVVPIYSDGLHNDKTNSRVMLLVTVDEKGDVEHADFLRGDPNLAAAAVETIKKWKFEPFIRNGHPVKVTDAVPVDLPPTAEEMRKARPVVVGGIISRTPITSAGPQHVRIAQSLGEKLLISKVQPNYPEPARSRRIQGAVVLRATIGADGVVRNLEVVSGHPMLTTAAINAVKQWIYRPYVVNGQPIEVETQITVSFTLVG